MPDLSCMQAAVIWMIGEYGQLVEDGPYILEALIDDFANEKARVVRLEVRACVCCPYNVLG